MTFESDVDPSEADVDPYGDIDLSPRAGLVLGSGVCGGHVPRVGEVTDWCM